MNDITTIKFFPPCILNYEVVILKLLTMKRKKGNILGSKPHLSLGLFVHGDINYSKRKKSSSISLRNTFPKYTVCVYYLSKLVTNVLFNYVLLIGVIITQYPTYGK